jgi:hypothetical protein
MIIDGEASADDEWIGTETAVPVPMAEHGNGFGGRAMV